MVNITQKTANSVVKWFHWLGWIIPHIYLSFPHTILFFVMDWTNFFVSFPISKTYFLPSVFYHNYRVKRKTNPPVWAIHRLVPVAPFCLILCSWLSFSVHLAKCGISLFLYPTLWMRKCFKGQNCSSFKYWFTEELELWFIIRALKTFHYKAENDYRKSHPHLFFTSFHYGPCSCLSPSPVFA